MTSDEPTPTPQPGTPEAAATGPQPVRRAGFLAQAGAAADAGAPQGTAPTGEAPHSAFRSAFRPTTGVGATGAAAAGTHPGAHAASGAPHSAGAPHSTGAPTGARTSAFPAAGAAGAGASPASAATSATAASPASGMPVSAARAAAFGPGATADASHKQLATVDKPATEAASSGPRKARVLVSGIDPLSAVKIGFLLSIAAGIMLVVAVHVLWQVLNQMGTFDLIQDWVSRLFTSGEGGQELNILQFFEYAKIMSATIIIAVVNVVILTGLAAVWALLYNFISRVVGGIYVTLTDD